MRQRLRAASRTAGVRGPVLGILLACLAACGPHQEVGATRAEPFTAVPIAGSKLVQLRLEPAAVQTLGIRTATVGVVPGSTGPTLSFPSAALMYGPDGASFVYVSPAANTYARHAVTVDHVDGDDAVVREGPEQGTTVVTQGAAELMGMEFGLEDE